MHCTSSLFFLTHLSLTPNNKMITSVTFSKSKHLIEWTKSINEDFMIRIRRGRFYISIDLFLTSSYAVSLRRCAAKFATATLHIEHSIRGLNQNVAILLNMQSRSREATVTNHNLFCIHVLCHLKFSFLFGVTIVTYF